MSTRRSLAAPQRCGRGSAEAQGGVRTPFTGRNFARKAERRSRDRVGSSGNRRSAPDPTKGPPRWKASQAVTSHRSSRFDGHGCLGGFLTVRSTGNLFLRREAPNRPRVPRARTKVCEHGRQEEEATGMSEARSKRHRGKTTPTLESSLRQRKRARGLQRVVVRPAKASEAV